ncbi:MAG: hypothetical protein HZA90_21835 [Verrucomicrobia bacterium]|nr:hypothetical protein [Verrucomicrobiota bacterium]
MLPEPRWHYVFHGIVLLVTLSYWLGSLVLLPEASWAEIIMYRPKGDNQTWPVITALSRLNFGDPTDALYYGQGIGGFHAVILLPYALAVAAFGSPGYMVADACLAWFYFLAITLLLRRCNWGNLFSLVAGTALATGALQNLSQKLSQPLGKLANVLGHAMTENDFPSLLSLPLFDKRIPRAMITEALVVLVLYFLVRSWQERRALTLQRGLAVGSLMALLAQGDPYSFSVLGLAWIGVVIRCLAATHWRWFGRFLLGGLVGALVFGVYFLFQLHSQSPASAVRFGLATYPRTEFLLLPGYGPWLRVAVIGALAGLVAWTVRRWRSARQESPPAGPRSTVKGNPHDPETSAPRAATRTECAALRPDDDPLATAAAVGSFSVLLVVCAWLAQPVQVFLLGQGAQLYHYLVFTLPVFYAYALLLLLFNLLCLRVPGERAPGVESPPPSLRWRVRVLLALALTTVTLLGLEEPIGTIQSTQTARAEMSPWWRGLEDQYRPNFRALEKAFRDYPTLREGRTFATFYHEVNFLLTAFHGKRAYLPDNGFTTLSDGELERRLCEVSKIYMMTPGAFAEFIQDGRIMNFWLGCAKYWCASDHRFATEDNYSAEELSHMRQLPKQAAFNLVLPTSELSRLVDKYKSVLDHPSDALEWPDLLVLTPMLRSYGFRPCPQVYHEVYTNEVFSVYAKAPGSGS